MADNGNGTRSRCPNGSRRDKNTGACHQTLSVFAQHLAQQPVTDVDDRLAGQLMLTSKETKGHLDRIAARKRWSRRASEAILQTRVYRNAHAVNAAVATGASRASIQRAMIRLVRPGAVDGDKYALQRLINAGADVRLLGADAIRAVLRFLPTSIGRIIFASGLDINTVDAGFDMSPLHLAVETRDAESVEKMIVEFGADVNSFGRSTYSPLARACYQNSEDMVALLIGHGADVNSRSLDNGMTPLMHAALVSRPSIISLLLASGARVNDRSAVDQTALWYSRHRSDRQASFVLRNAGGIL